MKLIVTINKMPFVSLRKLETVLFFPATGELATMAPPPMRVWRYSKPASELAQPRKKYL